MRTIEAVGFTLEPQTVAHADEMFAVLSDPAIYAFENALPPSLDWLRARFAKLETRRSPDGCDQWLNWVVRLPTSALAGYVQATVHPDGSAGIGYELTSVYWGRGLGRQCVRAMLRELTVSYGVTTVFAMAKRDNLRSVRRRARQIRASLPLPALLADPLPVPGRKKPLPAPTART